MTKAINISMYHKIDLHSKNLKKLKKSCDEFESEILNFYLKEALNSKNTLFPKSPGEDIYKAMYEETLSQKLSGSFGYSKLLFDYLKSKV
jgi:Rod binding domain-containing protein